MKTIHKKYRIALLRTKEQEVLLRTHFGYVRLVFNHFLSETTEQYRENTSFRRTADLSEWPFLERDINASKQILEEGLRIIGAELSDNTGRALHKTSEKKHRELKSEAHWS